MSTSKDGKKWQDAIHRYNTCLDCELKARWGITVETYKVIRALVQLTGVLAGIMAMHLGADPELAFILIAFIYGGPEAFEYVLTNQRED